MANKLELTWIGKEEVINPEPRILIEDKEKSYGDTNTENMLIHGDNLLALKALENKFTNKIKCIYIDPPYNTGSAFEHYDDNLEHSIWLNLMKERLNILKNLLSQNGVICIHCDDSEQPYLKVVCDEIFGRDNFNSMITVETGEVFGKKAAHINKTYVKVKDYILVYIINKTSDYTIKPLWTKTNEPFDSHYSNYIVNKNRIKLVEHLKSINWIKELFEQYKIDITLENISKLMILNNRFKKYINEQIADKIFQDQPYSAKVSEEINKKLNMGDIVENENLLLFKTSSGSIRYYKPFSDSIHYTDDYIQETTRATARGDLWKNFHIDMRNIDKEGNVIFKASKKPERLIRDVIYTFSEEGDLILDSFLGSGTTCAVAHKMNRKWIGIEMGEHCYTHCIPRINSIIDGSDYSGITKRVNWQGGGGYKFYELAPTLIKEDDFGQQVINDQYNPEMLASAVALHEGFEYKPSKDLFWKQAVGTENSYLYVTTNHVTENSIESIKNSMKESEYVVVACTSYDNSIKNKYKNILLKKIPQSLLKNCEYGKEDYSLNIINPPEYEDTEEYE